MHLFYSMYMWGDALYTLKTVNLNSTKSVLLWHSLYSYGSYKGLMSNVNSPFYTSSIGLSKTHSFILSECFVGEKSMTKYGDFVQNRQNWSTSNACRIAGTHIAFRFFLLKTYIYHSWTKKTSYGRFPMASIPTKNSQVTIPKWSQSLMSPDGSKP